MLGYGFPPLTRGDVRQVTVPALLLTSEQNPPFLLRLTDRLEQLLPSVTRTETPPPRTRCTSKRHALNPAILAFLNPQ